MKNEKSARLGSIAAVIAVLTIAVAASSCGYSLAGRGSFLPAHIKTIAMPLFVNNTPVFEIERRVTDAVSTELIGRGRFAITSDRAKADAVLIGEIVSIGIAPSAFNQSQQATRYTMTLVAKIEFRDLKSDKVLWQTPGMSFSEQYDVTTTTTATDPNAFLGQNTNAQERLSREFARAVVSAILEAF